jgi:hypothetical protein
MAPDGFIGPHSKKKWFIAESSKPSKLNRWNENGVLVVTTGFPALSSELQASSSPSGKAGSHFQGDAE